MHQEMVQNINLPSCTTQQLLLKDKNWFQTGGKAQFFARPSTAQEFQDALYFAATHQLPITLLGEGANVLISDDGIAGLVISPTLKGLYIISCDEQHMFVCAGAGVSMNDLINYCLEHNLTGLEEFSGIPGSIGGSVYINLHYFEFLLSQFLVSAQVINKKSREIIDVDHAWFCFGYNYSSLHDGEHYLINATFKLKKSTDQEKFYAQGRRDEIMRHRFKRYPTSGTCGSFFRNFLDHEVTLISSGKKIIYVAYYLDKVGIKGELKSGGAIVSYQHANMIVNQGSATTNDIIILARAMQQLVLDQFGIIPQPECRLLGFKEYPLLK